MSDIEINVQQALGASGGALNLLVTLYVPTRNRDGDPIGDAAAWLEEGLELLSEAGGGATAMLAEGAWLNPDSDALIREAVHLVYAYVAPQAFELALPNLREYLHRLGRETDQGEVVLEISGRLYRIQQFDRA